KAGKAGIAGIAGIVEVVDATGTARSVGWWNDCREFKRHIS
ncbi:MAG: hypothetical protein ACI8SJ_002129, partial [Shewanella sp.]